MPSGYHTKTGTDYDDEFDFYVQGDVGTPTERRSSDGNDLNRRYAPLAYGAKAPDVGHRDATGSDLSNRWARKGSASYSLACNGVTYVGSSTALTSEGGTQIGRVSFVARANGTWGIAAEGSSTGGDPRSGTWLPNGQAASNYEVQYQLDISWSQGNKAGTTQNDAANYATLTSDFASVVTASASSGSGQECYGGGRLTIRIRNKSTGTVNTTTITIRAEAAGHR